MATICVDEPPVSDEVQSVTSTPPSVPVRRSRWILLVGLGAGVLCGVLLVIVWQHTGCDSKCDLEPGDQHLVSGDVVWLIALAVVSGIVTIVALFAWISQKIAWSPQERRKQ